MYNGKILSMWMRFSSFAVLRNSFSPSFSSPAEFRNIVRMFGSGDGVRYTTEECGSLYKLDYRVFLKDAKGYISAWHDVPLFADRNSKIYNMIVEIPRWTNAKMEMATKEPMSPIRQDVKNGEPRFVDNVFPHHGYIWNYGALPQTWEDPNHITPETGAKGDNDPIDVIEIGSQIQKRGSVIQVKVLGSLALIDEGETDWKVVSIDISDPLSSQLNSINDVEKHLPGLLKATHEWFRLYKIPAGKPANKFGFNGQFKDVEYTQERILETHEFWKLLIKNPSPSLNNECSIDGAAFRSSQEKWEKIVKSIGCDDKQGEIPARLDHWHFIKQ